MDHPSRNELAERGIRARMLLTSFPKSGTNIIGQMWTKPDGTPPVWIVHGDNHLYPDAPYCTRQDRFATEEKVITKIREFTGAAWSHLAYRESFARVLENTETAVYILIRDPRACAVSQVFHARKWPKAGLNFHYADGSQLKDKPDPLKWIIESLPLRWDQYIPWLSFPNIFVVRFEDLVKNRLGTAEQMVAHACPYNEIIGIGSANIWLSRIDAARSPTYREGTIKGWEKHFEPRHHKLFNDLMADRMEILGYEI